MVLQTVRGAVLPLLIEEGLDLRCRHRVGVVEERVGDQHPGIELGGVSSFSFGRASDAGEANACGERGNAGEYKDALEQLLHYSASAGVASEAP
ncbi:hypothetical protein F8O05_00195 [Gulosibacter chungangensis]|uniref:Uncharacterized protein n=1 Tax=Gulosibacter chungangensis TaxID=979746 RepID=A0A7J5BEQ8_9MICO|nr:hypothetical protein F8O05_00195 [Gulosibacter chungangensis]